MIAGQGLFRFLLFADGGQVLFGAEAGIGQAALHQFLTKSLVDRASTALLVGAVIALFLGLAHHALVKFHAEITQARDDAGDAVLHFPLLVGVLDAQDDPAAALVGQPLVDQGGEQTADVEKAGGAGGKPGDHGPLGQVPGRIDLCEIFLHGFVDVGEQQFRQFIMIHYTSTPNFPEKFSLGTV